jgi:hypothetical protein
MRLALEVEQDPPASRGHGAPDRGGSRRECAAAGGHATSAAAARIRNTSGAMAGAYSPSSGEGQHSRRARGLVRRSPVAGAVASVPASCVGSACGEDRCGRRPSRLAEVSRARPREVGAARRRRPTATRQASRVPGRNAPAKARWTVASTIESPIARRPSVPGAASSSRARSGTNRSQPACASAVCRTTSGLSPGESARKSLTMSGRDRPASSPERTCASTMIEVLDCSPARTRD